MTLWVLSVNGAKTERSKVLGFLSAVTAPRVLVPVAGRETQQVHGPNSST
jgi:hypothetical protein